MRKIKQVFIVSLIFMGQEDQVDRVDFGDSIGRICGGGSILAN